MAKMKITMDKQTLGAPGSGSGAHARPSSILLSRSEIQARVHDLAQEIDEHYKMQPFTMLVVLDGAMVFATHLMRAIKIPFKVATIKCKSYEAGAPGKHLKITQAPDLDGSPILIVEDIVDSGRTIQGLKHHLRLQHHDPKIVTLLHRDGVMKTKGLIDWTGFLIQPGFVYGYGLDDELGRGRGLKDIWVRGVDMGRSRGLR